MSARECFYEMTLIGKADSRSDLLDTEESFLQQVFRLFQPNVVDEAHNRHAGLLFEQMAQTPRRKIHQAREFVQADFFTRVSLNERHDFFYPAIHARTTYPTTIGRSINYEPRS